MKYYKDLRTLQENPLKKIKPSMVIKEDCYLEILAKTMKYSTINNFTSERKRYSEKGFITDSEGILFIAKDKLLLVADGTKKFLLKNVISVNSNPLDNIIEIILINRKTPVYFSTPENAKVMIIINKLLKDRD